MRFLIHELAYEEPLAAGRLAYLRDGQPTGAVEHWRLTTAVDGYRFLRVDLDARDAASGNSYLFHLTLNPDGRPERLSFRIWGPGRRADGNVLLDETAVTVARRLSGADDETAVSENLLAVPAGYAFWFPASVGLSQLAGRPAGPLTAVILGYDDALTLARATASVRHGPPETKSVVRQSLLVRPLTVSWADQWRTIWLDDHQWPVEMTRQDGLTAVATRYIRHQST